MSMSTPTPAMGGEDGSNSSREPKPKREKREGNYQRYNKEGNLVYECFYVNGKKHGVEREYTEDGYTTHTHYWKGVPNGPFYLFRKNKIDIRRFYVNGLLNGEEKRSFCAVPNYYVDDVEEGYHGFIHPRETRTLFGLSEDELKNGFLQEDDSEES